MLNGLGVSYHKKMLFSLIAPLLQVDQDRKRSSALRFADVENQSVGGIYYNITRYLKHKPVSTGQCPQLFLWPPNFVVFRKICFKHIIWTKILSPKNVFCPPPNLETWLLAFSSSEFYVRIERELVRMTVHLSLCCHCHKSLSDTSQSSQDRALTLFKWMQTGNRKATVTSEVIPDDEMQSEEVCKVYSRLWAALKTVDAAVTTNQ